MSKKIAVILAGCGHLDGAEIRESILTFLELDRQGADVKVFAPDSDQFHVINHAKQEPTESEKRNCLTEASRLTRGPISPLSELSSSQFDALIMPGGFGVAKNLSKFAFDGPTGAIDPQLKKVVEGFYADKKPIGAICISPAIMAMILGKHGVTLTIGDQQDVAQAIESVGAKHKECATDEICIDQNHKIISTPAYMDDNARLHKVEQGIQKLVQQVLEMA